ncbi:MAG: hypothetical protein MR299_03270 [Bacteroidales bacterium]|nr:hypothetical protein [Bacteroidales bacterium]
MSKITVQETQVTVLQWEGQDYISLTDMAAAKEGESRAADIIKVGSINSHRKNLQ